MPSHKRSLLTLAFTLTLFLATTTLLPQSSEAYVRIRTTSGILVKWPTLPVTWYYNHGGFTQFTQQQMTQIMQSGFQNWMTPNCTSFRATYGGTTAQQWSSFDGVNVLIWNPQIPNPQFAQALALMIPNVNQSNGDFLDVDIVFNSSYSWSTQPTGQQFDVLGTTTHEIGHLVGLDHTSVPDASMFATAAPGLCPCRTLKQDDIDGVCAIYPAGANPTGRKLGESCSLQNTCASGLTCVTTQQGSQTGICLNACSNINNFCPSGEKCYDIGGSGACACQSNADCNNGKSCQNNQCTGATSTNNRQLGEACDLQNDCANGLVCVVTQQGAQSGICFEECTQSGRCTTGERCTSLNNGRSACVCQGDNECPNGNLCKDFRCVNNQNLRKIGEVCSVSIRCEAGLTCVVTTPNASSGFCLALCQNAGGRCTTGEPCVPLGNGENACACQGDNECNNGKGCRELRCVGDSNEGAKEGERCNPTCQSGLNCLGNPSVDGICVRPCQQDSQCASIFTKCDTARQHCVAENKGTRQRGETCDPQNLCVSGLFCTVLQQGAQTGVCLPICNPQDANPCAGGERCEPLQTGGQGVCLCQSNDHCRPGGVCQQYACSGGTIPGSCSVDSQCKDTEVCRNSLCVARNSCQTNQECPLNQVCLNNLCTTPAPERIPEDGGNTGSCTPPCAAGTYCQRGVCITTPECQTDAECGSNATCQEYACVPKALPEGNQPPPGGCRCDAEITPPLSFLFLLLFALAFRRRRLAP
jgi:hypothetical protein